MGQLLWVWRQAWNVKYERLRESNETPFNVNGEDWLGDLRDWEQFADENYQDVLPSLTEA